MKKLLILLFFAAFTSVVSAQNYDMQYVIRMINTRTDLTTEQREKLLVLSAKYYPQALEIQNSSDKDEVKYIKAKALKKDIDAELKDLLSDTQFDSYQKMCDDYERKLMQQMKQNN